MAFGVEGVLSEAEARGIHYVAKLKITKNVKRLIERLFEMEEWVKAGAGYYGMESELKLFGWSRSRRVVVLRRPIPGNILLQKKGKDQVEMSFLETQEEVATNMQLEAEL